jgi:hypothetical protein
MVRIEEGGMLRCLTVDHAANPLFGVRRGGKCRGKKRR